MGVDQATKNIPKGKYHFGWSGSRRDYLMINYRKTQSSENKSVGTRQIKTAKPELLRSTNVFGKENVVFP